MTSASEGPELFWRLVESRVQSGSAERGTIMGRACVRAGGAFVAMPHSHTGALVVKLSADRVRALIDDGVGEAFAPSGRVFSEWVSVPEPDESSWAAILDEAFVFASQPRR
jgi:hypothetical protein